MPLTDNQRKIIKYLNSQPNNEARLCDMRAKIRIYAGPAYFSQGIDRMLKKGLIERVKRGVYRSLTPL